MEHGSQYWGGGLRMWVPRMFMAIVVTRGLIVAISHCGLDPQIWGKQGHKTKLMHVKANVVPSHLRVSHGTILPVYAKTRSPGNISLCLGSKHLGRIQAYQGKIEEITKIQMARGGGGVPSHPHMVATLGNALCNPWKPTRLQPYAQTQTRHTKNTTQRLPKWWWSTDRIDMATVTHVNQITSNICWHIPKLQSRRQLDCAAKHGWFGHNSF